MTANHSQPNLADTASSNAATTGKESMPELARNACQTWLLMAVVGTVAITLAASHAPAPMRKLFVFSIICGLLLAEGYLLLCRVTDCRLPTGKLLAISCCLILASQIGVALETHRQYRQAILKSISVDSEQRQISKAMVASAKSKNAPNDKPSAELAEQQKLQKEFQESLNDAIQEEAAIRREQASFSAYMQRRIQALGDWPSTVAWAIWIAELTLAILAGGYSIWRRNLPTSEHATADIPANSEQSSDRS